MQQRTSPPSGRAPSLLLTVLAPVVYFSLAAIVIMLSPPVKPALALAQGTPTTLTQPYAKLCFAPEWWVVEAHLRESFYQAKVLETLQEAKSIFCAADTPASLTSSDLAARQLDTVHTLERLRQEIAEAPDNSDNYVARVRVNALKWLAISLPVPR